MKTTLMFLIAAVNCAFGDWRLVHESPPGNPDDGVTYITRRFQHDDDGRQIELHAVLFNSRKHTLKIVDSPRQNTTNLGAAMAGGSFLAGVNGGYFTPAFQPLGLVVSGGVIQNRPARTRLLSGVLAVTRDRILLLRSGEFKLGAKTLEALQAGPFLVDDAQPARGLNDLKRAARTFLATDGRAGCALGAIYSPTLAEAGALLSSPDALPGLKVKRALNFDGGRSTGFWVRTQPKPSYLGEISSVRNFIGLIPRPD